MPDLGQAWVGVGPDLGGFGTKLRAGLSKALAGIDPAVPVSPDLGGFRAKLLASVKKAMAGAGAEVPVTAAFDAMAARAQVMAAFKGLHPEVQATIDVDAAMAAAEVAAALAGVKPDIPVGLDVRGAAASIQALRLLMSQRGLADFLDIDVQPGRIMSQLMLLKRRMAQTGISDLLEVNLNRQELSAQLAKISSVTETIPVNFDVSKVPLAGALAPLTEAVQEIPETAGFRAALIAAVDKASAGVTGDVTAVPDTSGFRAALIAAVEKASAGLSEDFPVDPDTSGFRAKLIAAVETASAGVTDDIPVDPDAAGFRAKLIAAVKTASAGLSETVPVDFDVGALPSARLLGEPFTVLTGDIDTAAQAARQLGDEEQATTTRAQKLAAALRTLIPATGALGGGGGAAGTAAGTAIGGSAAAKVAAPTGKMIADWSELSGAELAATISGLKALGSAEAITAALKAMGTTAGAASGDLLGFTDTARGAEIAAAAASVQIGDMSGGRGGGGLLGVAAAADDAGGGARRLAPTLAGLVTNFGALSTKIPLFGGALQKVLPAILTQVSVLHVLGDAVLEIAAVWIPAGIAVAAWGAVAAPVIIDMTKQLENMNTVTQATGGHIAFMNGAVTGAVGPFQALQNAVKPGVYQLFGDALTVMTAKTGEFGKLIPAVSGVLDQLGARLTYALTAGNGFSQFMTNAIPDLSTLGNAFGDLFGIIGNLIKDVPGYAEVLLNLGQDFLSIAENVTRVAAPVIALGLALHGAILYSGLAVTGLVLLAGAVSRLALSFITLASEGALAKSVASITLLGSALTTAGLAIAAWVESMVAADGAMATFEAAIAPLLAVNPLVWVAAAVVALGALVYWLNSSRTAAQQFNASMQQTISNASLVSLQTTLQQAAAATAAQLSGAQKTLNTTLQQQAPAVTGAATRWSSNYSPAVDHATQSVQQLTAGQAQIAAQSQLVNSRIASLSKTYGSNQAALGALSAANITSSQILDTNTQHWKEAQIQIASTALAYQDMGVQAGALGNFLQIMGAQATDQYVAMGKLNTAVAQFITDVTSAPVALNALDQGFITMASDASTAGVKLSGLSTFAKGLSANALTLGAQFDTQVTGINTWAASLRQAGLGTTETGDAVKAAIGPLLGYAKGSTSATNALLALAYSAGAPASVNSYKTLTDWIGKLGGSQKIMQAATNDATTAMLNQTTQAQALSTAMGQTLSNAMALAIFQARGGQTAFNNFADSISSTGQQSAATQAKADALAGELLSVTGNATQAKAQFLAFAGQLGLTKTAAQALWNTFVQQKLTAAASQAGETKAQFEQLAIQLGDTKQQAQELWDTLNKQPKNVAIVVTEKGTGLFTITGSVIAASQGKGGSGNAAGGLAAGGIITMGSGPTADDVLARVSKGETVVSAADSKVLAPAFAALGVPGYASGGVPAGSSSSYSGNIAGLGPATAQFSTNFQNTMTAAMEASMTAATKAAQAAANAAAAATRSAGGKGGAVANGATITAALRSLGVTGTALADALEIISLESGGSLTAQNPSSGAYGIAQFINGPGEYAQYGGNANTVAGQITAFYNYVMQRYGSFQAALAFHLANGYYSKGGLIPGYAKGGSIGSEGAAYLKAWKPGAGTVNSQIAHWAHEQHLDTTLAGATLPEKLKAQYKAAEAGDKKKLAALNTELGVMRDWRTQLSGSDSSLSSWIKAAGTTKALRADVAAWKKQLASQKATIGKISAMLGPTAATLAAARAAASAASAASTASSAAASTASSGLSSSAGSSAGSTASSTPGVTISAAQALQLLNLASSVGGAPSGLMPSGGLPAVVPGAAAWFDNGGVITEPILGRGMSSGRLYGFGGNGPETVTPGRSGRGHGLSDDAKAIVGAMQDVAGRIDKLTGVTGGQGTQYGRALNGLAQKAGQSGQYNTRQMPL